MSDNIRDIRVTELKLSDESKNIVSKLRSSMAYLRDNYPQELSEALGEVVRGVDVEAQTTNSLVGYLAKYLEQAEQRSVDIIDASEDFISKLSYDIEKELSMHLDAIDSRIMSFNGSVTPRGEFKESNDAFVSADGQSRTCYQDCDDPNTCETNGEWSDCFIECYCYNPSDDGYDDDGSGNWWGNAFNTAVETVGNIAEDIGWDNIYNSLFVTGDDGDDTTTNVYIDEGGDEEEKGFNWLYLGVGVLVTVTVVGTVIYLVKRKKE